MSQSDENYLNFSGVMWLTDGGLRPMANCVTLHNEWICESKCRVRKQDKGFNGLTSRPSDCFRIVIRAVFLELSILSKSC